MYRGIIQDAPWLNPQARENIQKNGLDQNIQHGRIWRIRHRDFEPDKSTDLPSMSEDSTISLIRHLESNSGWYRDTAQREILLREDRESIAPHLAMIARFSQNPLGRLHALWTLHGMEKADLTLLSHLASDRDPRIRRAVVQIGEPLLAEDAAFDAIARRLATDGDPEVAKQLILSLGLVRDHPDAVVLIQETCRRHKSIAGVQFAATLSLWGMKELPLIQEINSGKGFDDATAQLWKNSLGNWDRGLKFPDDMPDAEQRRIGNGEEIYFKNCVSCHGADGKGISIPGTEMSLAPSLTDSARVKGNPRQLVPIFFHGLTGTDRWQDVSGRIHGARADLWNCSRRPALRADYLHPVCSWERSLICFPRGSESDPTGLQGSGSTVDRCGTGYGGVTNTPIVERTSQSAPQSLRRKRTGKSVLHFSLALAGNTTADAAASFPCKRYSTLRG